MEMADTTSIDQDVAAALNRVIFARLLRVEPDPWQEEVLRSDSKRIILNCARQSGKSTITAILALHLALYVSDSLVLIVSPSLRQSSEMFTKIIGFYHDLDKPIPAEKETALTLQLANKSRIVSLPSREGTVRGFSGASLIVIDEAAWVPDDLYFAVRPMLTISQGRLILLSTPHGREGFFYEAWTKEKGWGKIKISADQCPRMTPEVIEAEKASMPSWRFRQEYQNSFEAGGEPLINPDSIEKAFVDRPGRDLDF
jgi:Terminase large subunit, T4likevirus-type, N-terminal